MGLKRSVGCLKEAQVEAFFLAEATNQPGLTEIDITCQNFILVPRRQIDRCSKGCWLLGNIYSGASEQRVVNVSIHACV
jgi:hypothetical protein